MDNPERVEIVPSEQWFSPQISLSNVDLPAPFGPTSARRDVGWMPNDTSLNR